MTTSNYSYQDRPVTIINVLDHDVEIIKPESVVLKMKTPSRAGDSYIDIGSLCFRMRLKRFPRKINSNNPLQDGFVKVVLSSKEEWRVTIIIALIEHIRTQVITKSLDTTLNIIKVLYHFFEFCEKHTDFNRRSQTFEGFVSIYRDYTDYLSHRNKLAPNNPNYMLRASSALSQRIVRRFIQNYFNKAEIDIIRHVPSLKRGADKNSIVAAPSLDNRDLFIRFSVELFYGLADGIINQNYAPIKLTLPVRGGVATCIYSDPTANKSVILNQDLSWPSFSSSDKIIHERWTNADVHQRDIIRKATIQAMVYRSLKTPSHALHKAYVLAQSAFIACFYAATGINPTPLVNLKITSDVPKTLRGMRFSGLKARAGNITVYPEFGADFLKIFNRFRELRSYVAQYFGDRDLWFFRPIGHSGNLYADATLIPLKLFINEREFDVPILSPTQIRKSVSIDFLKLSNGDLFITSQKLGNTINTVASNYTANDPLEQSREFSEFYQKMFLSALERTRSHGGLIGVLNASFNDLNIPAGHCSNFRNEAPHRIDAFTEVAPQPDCSRPETCLFCKYYSIIPDKEDIEKIIGLKELINLVKINCGTADKYVKILAPVFHRINEILEIIIRTHPQAESIIAEVQTEVELGILCPFWKEHYDFLNELGAQV